MISTDKTLLRLAAAIHTSLTLRCHQDRFIDLPNDSWQRCTDLVRQIRRAHLRGWHLAARALAMDLRLAIPSVQAVLAEILAHLPADSQRDNVSTVGDIYQDLLALGDEFEEMSFDRNRHWLSVTTEPIELEGIYLGPFDIRLEWTRPRDGDLPTYRVVAKDPHPAECRDSVTHPHVMDELLCEGDGKHAIRQAWSQGRILDFFTLVAGVLRNYNSESPFVELALWYGQSCSDCGAVVSEEERYVCHRCGETVCAECEVCCSGCDDSCCSSCNSACAECDDSFCRQCLRQCAGCQASVCTGCLQNERCSNCHEDEELESVDDTPRSAGAALQSHGVGQALVPA